MKLSKKFRCRGSLWNEVEPSTLGQKYLTIRRPISLYALKRQGLYVTAIDVTREEVPTRLRELF
jgi:hypothetical protein